MKLNGWLRLWVLVSALSLFVVISTGIHLQLPKTKPEGMQQIEVRSTKQTLSLPKSMSHNEIVELIKEHEAQGEMELEKQAQIRRLAVMLRVANENTKIRQKNISRWFQLMTTWSVSIMLLLLVGYGVGWVKDGFKNT